MRSIAGKGIYPDNSTEVEDREEIDEYKGKLASEFKENKLMHSVMKGDKDSVEDAKLIESGINNNVGNFKPDMMMQNLVKNYSQAKEIYGETILRLLSSYSPGYIEKNINIPEFRRELQKSMEDKVKDLKDKNLLDEEGNISETGEKIASLIMYTDELDNIKPKGLLGEKVHKRHDEYGTRDDIDDFKKGDRYCDIATKKSVSLAIKRQRESLRKEDLKKFTRKSKGKVYIIYGLDASGSMKGKKIEAAKKAGIALSYKAITEKDKVGLVVFESEIKDSIPPTNDFPSILKKISGVRASKQTDFKSIIDRAIDLFPEEKNVTKHLVLLTDAMPTVGDKPEKETLNSIGHAKESGITTSLVGLGLEDKGKELGKTLTELGGGKFYVVNNLDMLDKIILEDYYEFY